MRRRQSSLVALSIALSLSTLPACSPSAALSTDDDAPRSSDRAAETVRASAPDSGRLLTLESARALLAAIRAGAPRGALDSAGLPRELREDRETRVVVLSASTGNAAPTIAEGAGAGWIAAVDAALGAMPADRRSTPMRWVRLDVVTDLGDEEILGAGSQFAPLAGLEGIALRQPVVAHILPEELWAQRILDTKGRFHRKLFSYYLTSGRSVSAGDVASLGTEPIRGRRFRSTSFFFDGERAQRLYRGRAPRSRFTASDLLAAVTSAGDYLARATRENGKFDYSYLPGPDRVESSYNLVRHAGTIFALLEVAAATRRKEYGDAVERAIQYLLARVRRFGSADEPLTRVVVEGDKIKLGGVALTILALTEYWKVTGSDRYKGLLASLARYIGSAQKPSGEFISQLYYSTGKARDWTSEYYPGEAIFALCRLHALDENPDWIDIAARGADYLILGRDKGVATLDLIHDHWLLYGLNELHRYRPEERYLTHASRIVTAILAAQRPANSSLPDLRGAWGRRPRSTPAATRAEGLLAAYRLFRRNERDKLADRILDAVALTTGYQLATQFTPPSALFFPNPQRALGGFACSFERDDIRIDYVQHNISALLALRRVMIDEKRGELGVPFVHPDF